jgi:hypothetical protein
MTSRSKTTRRHGIDRRSVIAGLAAPALFGLMPRRARAALPSASYTVIANDFVGGVNFIDGTVRCAINPAGRVAFVASQLLPPPTFEKAVFHGRGGTLAKLATESRGYTAVKALQIGTANRIAIAATRTSGSSSWQGIYRVTKPSVTTIYEGALPYMFGNPPPAQGRLEMANDGTTLAFASLVNGQGGLYRSGFSGAPTLLRQGSGIFYNNRGLGVNALAIAAELEYGDPYGGLRRGALVFDSAADTLGTIETTIERAGIGTTIPVALNAAGQMAFIAYAPTTIQYYSAPLGGGVPTTTLDIPAGVHVATPTAFGTPFTFTTIAAATDGFSSFGAKVAINDSAAVVFEATAADGRSGVFFGNDPVADVVAVNGEDVVMAGQNHFFSIVRLGGLNNAGQVAFQTSDFRTTDQQIWRAQLPT